MDIADKPMLSRYWWVVLLRGIFSIIFGFLAFTMPGLTLFTLVLLWGAYALVDGIMAMVAGVRTRAWSMLLIGLLGLAAGFITFINPNLTAVALLYFIAAWAIARGIFEIVTAIEIRKEITNEWLLILSGILSVLFGIALLWRPLVGALAMIWLIAAFAIVFGIMLIPLAFRLRHTHEDHTHPHGGTHGTHSIA
jgi:uncharacterized membrane protein HdeD (DUF308 family)